jgi:hypothetical protein
MEWGDKSPFWECLGSPGTLPVGTPDSIREAVGKLHRTMGRGGGFILVLQPDTLTPNAMAVVDAFADDHAAVVPLQGKDRS